MGQFGGRHEGSENVANFLNGMRNLSRREPPLLSRIHRLRHMLPGSRHPGKKEICKRARKD